MAVDEDRVRAHFCRSTQRHSRVHSKLAGFIRRRRDHATLVALSSNHNGFAFQRRIKEFFDGDEEGIHVDMKDRSREDRAGKVGLVGSAHAEGILAAEEPRYCQPRTVLSPMTVNPMTVKMRAMPGRALRVTSRIVFFICGALSLLTGVPYAMLRGVDLPVQSEWIVFVFALGLIGVFNVAAALLPRSWFARVCKKDRDDERLFSVPLKLAVSFAAIAYLVALLAYFAPHSWNLDPQLMLSLCPMYFVKMTIDPSNVAIFFLLAPMNAVVYGALGSTLGYALLAFRNRH
jgi:hypothetical protein